VLQKIGDDLPQEPVAKLSRTCAFAGKHGRGMVDTFSV